MSRRRQRATRGDPREPAAGPGEPAASGSDSPKGPGEPARGRGDSAKPARPAGTAPGRAEPRISFLAQVGVLVAVFAIVSLIAELAGAANLGVALGIGQIAFAIALVAVIVKT
jgi:hypothetical protein